MSSVLLLPQRDSVHLACDAAAYNRETGVLQNVSLSKCVAIPTIRAAISLTGPKENPSLFARFIAEEFDTFDSLVRSADAFFPEIFRMASAAFRGGDACAQLYLIGWHEVDDRPAAYAMTLFTDEASHVESILAESAGRQVYAGLIPQGPTISGEPLPNAQLIATSKFDVLDDVDHYIPDVDLLHVMEIQRHEEIGGQHWVGGKCVLTTVTRNEVRQKVLYHWKEDRVGARISPQPIDYTAWRAGRMAARNKDVIPEGMSRLKREMLAKKLAKGRLRAA